MISLYSIFFTFLGEEDHYLPFESIYGTQTTEEHRPSLVARNQGGHQIPFSPSSQTANTVKQLLYCVDCGKPRVMYSQTKLSTEEKETLDLLTDVLQYSCGGVLSELKSPDNCRENEILDKVHVRANLVCANPVEIPYYSSKAFVDVCFHCGKKDDISRDEGAYPACNNCKGSKSVALKRKRNIWAEKQNKKSKK